VSTLRLALGVVSAVTALIVAWLAFVLVTVLPSRSPASIPAWLAIELLAVAALALGAAWLERPSASLAAATRIGGIAMFLVGARLVATWLLTPPGTDAEGYELLIGGWFVVHGIVAVVAPGVPGLTRAGRATPPG
jgi:hypothetical protein